MCLCGLRGYPHACGVSHPCSNVETMQSSGYPRASGGQLPCVLFFSAICTAGWPWPCCLFCHLFDYIGCGGALGIHHVEVVCWADVEGFKVKVGGASEVGTFSLMRKRAGAPVLWFLKRPSVVGSYYMEDRYVCSLFRCVWALGGLVHSWR